MSVLHIGKAELIFADIFTTDAIDQAEKFRIGFKIFFRHEFGQTVAFADGFNKHSGIQRKLVGFEMTAGGPGRVAVEPHSGIP